MASLHTLTVAALSKRSQPPISMWAKGDVFLRKQPLEVGAKVGECPLITNAIVEYKLTQVMSYDVNGQ